MTPSTDIMELESGPRHRYPGPRPFSRQDRDVFFGRDADRDRLVSLIEVEALTVLHGKSGCGKSSLLEAAVLPALESDFGYQVVPIRFNNYVEGYSWPPVELLRHRLREAAGGNDYLGQVQKRNVSCWQTLKQMQWASRDKCVVLVFDQFEELFTYSPAGALYLAKTLADLLHDRGPPEFWRLLRLKERQRKVDLSAEQRAYLSTPMDLRIVAIVRSDRLSLLDRLSGPLPFILRQCYELSSLSRADAARAMVEPAELAGEWASPSFSYSSGAIDKVLDYLEEEGTGAIETFQLQVMCQHVEQHLVIKNDKRQIDAETLGDIASVYENFYENSLRRFDAADRGKVRRFIEDGLIYEAEKRRVPLYEGQVQSDFEIGEELLRQLVDTHIIRPQPYAGGTFLYEISHDSLVEPILRSKGRRVEIELNLRIQQRWLQRKRRRKKRLTILLVLVGAIFVLPPALGWIWPQAGCFLGYAAMVLLYLLALASVVYIAAEFVTGESLLAKRERRLRQKLEAEQAGEAAATSPP